MRAKEKEPQKSPDYIGALFFFNALIAGPGVAPGPEDYAPSYITVRVGLYHHPRFSRSLAFSLYGVPLIPRRVPSVLS